MEPIAAVMDNSMKLTSFTALAAAIILFLNLLAGAHPTTGSIADPMSPSTLEYDTMLTSRTVAILGRGESRKITVPYFGSVEIARAEHVPVHSPGIHDDESMRTTNPTPASFVLNEPHDEVFPSWTVANDMFFAYHGTGRVICRNHLGPFNLWKMASTLAMWFCASISTRGFRFEVRDVIFWTPNVFNLKRLHISVREKTT
ncbi:hypothetical protein PENFLA_c009G02460 [Penicillium flavigenum]|uniref:Uncharacterized protein n=1 Tax=Penicillium flavigenum TaxID=254877 RepID=A0A1V6TH45_9EURO|nr:hypothetical protein PENFLA_c009G02460 [Penicillium flavigenum]